jgi:hypothetical protein
MIQGIELILGLKAFVCCYIQSKLNKSIDSNEFLPYQATCQRVKETLDMTHIGNCCIKINITHI